MSLTSDKPTTIKESSDIVEEKNSIQEHPQDQTNDMSIQSLIIKSITEPGANDAVVIAIHITFCSLLAVLASMVFVTRGNIHYIFLFFIAAILYGILTWFISEIKKIQAEEKKEVKSMSKDVYDNDTQVTKNSSTDDAKSSLKNLGKSMSE